VPGRPERVEEELGGLIPRNRKSKLSCRSSKQTLKIFGIYSFPKEGFNMRVNVFRIVSIMK
jgi:hypothetical protein